MTTKLRCGNAECGREISVDAMEDFPVCPGCGRPISLPHFVVAGQEPVIDEDEDSGIDPTIDYDRDVPPMDDVIVSER